MRTASPERHGPPLVVVLLGGESTGKSSLAHALQAALVARSVSATLVPEYLRTWCQKMGRVPHAEEQAGIAQEQNKHIEDAAATSGIQVVIADTSAFMVAVYSEIYFKDFSLYPKALQWQKQSAVSLLMGLDLPWAADGHFRDGVAHRDQTDTVLRQQMQSASLPFQTIYGKGEDRLTNALRIVGKALNTTLVPTSQALTHFDPRWVCERCSDPACEQRIFSRLL